MAQINIRIEEGLKNKASKTFASMGLDISSAVKLFIHQVVVEQRIPFEIRTANGYTKKYEDDLLREVGQVKEDIITGKTKGYKNSRKMYKDLGIK